MADIAETQEVESAEVDDTTLDDDVQLEDIEVSAEELEEAEDKTEESETDSESEEEDDTESDTESTDEAEEEPEAEELSDEEQQKAFNKEMAERRIQAKQEREARLKQDQQDYVAEAGEDPLDVAVRQLQMDAYTNKVTANTNKLTNDYDRAIKDFDVLRDATPEVAAEIDAAIDAFQAMYVSIDAYGNPQEVRGDLYNYLQTKADSIEKLTGLGARKQSQSKTKEKSKVLTTPNRAPKEPKKDSDLDAFDEEASKW